MKNILLVEDTLHLAEEIADILRLERYQVTIGNHGSQAIELLHKSSYDLMITDILMPGMDGFELIQYVRASLLFKSIPIIILSAKTSEEDRVRGIQLGANVFLLKPCKVTELLAAVHLFLPAT